MDALTDVRNEETHFQDADLLRVSSILTARSSVAHHAASVSPTSPLVTLSAARDAITSLHCDQCGQDGHVDAFCYRKKKAQKA
jgi:hypothetical protein